MENSEQELVISYTYDHKEFKKMNIHPTSLASIICCYIIPIAGLLLIELIFLVVGLISGFNEIMVFFMIIIPCIYGAVVLLFTPVWLIFLRILWKRANRLPLERKWIFTKEGIIIDKTYSKTLHHWMTIQNVDIGKKSIFFATINKKVFKLGFDPLPLRFLDDEQFESLLTILRKYLDDSRIKIKAKRNKK